ncbi:hypothetical protein TRFO_36245 [Tritrichomonas foetus]|uniref:Dedicator of cytokinesis family protein n=1 Tax=Tritrichomonas foetus TaxID=1144522 RepID=A0A1J4JJV3_9EUKA|nr:hypothetical protein TRFO_36245 [Tritrichomonas foetus]|eukprot:OHS97524.1 hypothetical protein TRFO_36245 [Tritrichomonas foetus]
MNSLTDDYITENIDKARQQKQYPWLRPIVEIMDIPQNPFLSKDFVLPFSTPLNSPHCTNSPVDSINSMNIFNSTNSISDSLEESKGESTGENSCESSSASPSPHSEKNLALNLFNVPLKEMKVCYSNFSEDDKNRKKCNSKPKIPYKKKLTGTMEFSEMYSIDLIQKKRKKVVTMDYVTFKFEKLVVPFSLVEPIMFSVFIYHKKSKAIVSNTLNVIHPDFTDFFTDVNVKIDSLTTATFQVDRKVINTSSIIILLSHPFAVEKGSNVLKYYTSQQNQSSYGKSAAKFIKQCFSKKTSVFSTFAWTAIDFPVNKSNDYQSSSSIITFPNPYITEKPLYEADIEEIMNDANRRYKQIPFQITFKIEEKVTDNIIRPISVFRSYPVLSPIHQLVVHLIGLKTIRFAKHNILIAMSLKESHNGDVITAIRSKFKPKDRINKIFSRCMYHEKCPKFDDYFLIELPFPVPPESCLFFEIYHVHQKPTETKPLDLIGTAYLNLYDKGIFIQDDAHTISLSSDRSSRLTVRTILKSNFITNYKPFHRFKSLIASPNISLKALERVKEIPPKIIISNLLVLLDILMMLFENSNNFYFQPFLEIAEIGKQAMKIEKIEKYLILYFHYFAFRKSSNSQVKSHHQHSISGADNQSTNSLLSVIDIENDELYEGTLSTNDISQTSDNINQQTDSNKKHNHNRGSQKIQRCATINKRDNNYKSKRNSNNISISEDFEFLKHGSISKVSPEIVPRMPRLNSTNNLNKLSRKPIHIKIINCYINFLNENPDDGIDKMGSFIGFFFLMIIKSIVTSKDHDLSDRFEDFTIIWSKCAAKSQILEKAIFEYALFVGMLFDVGLSTAATIASKSFIENNQIDSILSFVKTAFTPCLFFYSVVYIYSFKECLFHVFEMSYEGDNSIKMQPLFSQLNHLFSFYEHDNKIILASKLITCLYHLNVKKLPSINDILPMIHFFNILLRYIDDESIKKIVITEGSAQPLLNYINYLLTKMNMNQRRKIPALAAKDDGTFLLQKHQVKLPSKPNLGSLRPKKLGTNSLKCFMTSPQSSQPQNGTNNNIDVIETQKSIFRFIASLYKYADLDVAKGIMQFAYHAIEANLTDDFIPQVYDLISSLIARYSPKSFGFTSPCIVQVIHSIFKASLLSNEKFYPRMANTIITLFDSDLQAYKNNNRALMICHRALSLMYYSQLTLGKFGNFMCQFKDANNSALSKFYKTFERLRKISVALAVPKITSQQKAELLLKRFYEFKYSPDAQCSVLDDLKKHQIENSFYIETMNILILEASIVYEFSVRLNKMPNYYDSKLQGTTDIKLTNVHSIGQMSLCSNELKSDMPILPTFCDSEHFSELGFVSLLYNIFEIAVSINYSFFAKAMLDYAWPMFDWRRLYGRMSCVFEDYTNFFTVTCDCSTNELKIPFFLVSFYGKIFDEDNGKSYIYNAQSKTTLEDQQNYLKHDFEMLLGEKKVIILNKDCDFYQSDTNKTIIDKTKLDPTKGYIQVTVVEPTTVEKNATQFQEFFFDTPFVEFSENSLGTIETQCNKRTIVKAAHPIPNLISRCFVIETQTVVFDPMMVSYHRMIENTKFLSEALSLKEAEKIQQLLIEIMIENPDQCLSKIADVFLGKPNNDDRKDTMKRCIRDLVYQLKLGTNFHSKWVTKNPDVLSLQIQFEQELSILIEKLRPFMSSASF